MKRPTGMIRRAILANTSIVMAALSAKVKRIPGPSVLLGRYRRVYGLVYIKDLIIDEVSAYMLLKGDDGSCVKRWTSCYSEKGVFQMAPYRIDMLVKA